MRPRQIAGIAYSARKRERQIVVTPVDVWQSFNLTAGTLADGIGYSDGTSGSIDREPNPAYLLLLLAEQALGFSVLFVGDLSAILTGSTLSIDAVEYAIVELSYDAESGNTSALYAPSETPPVFVDGENYAVEFHIVQ